MAEGKADSFKRFGRQQSHIRHGKYVRHHRNLRPGHVNTGVTGELERSDRILLCETGMGCAGIETTWRHRAACCAWRRAYGSTKQATRATGIGEQVNNGGPQDVRLEVLAEHSTDGRCAFLAWTEKVAND